MIMIHLLSEIPEADMGIVTEGLISGGVSLSLSFFFVFTSHKRQRQRGCTFQNNDSRIASLCHNTPLNLLERTDKGDPFSDAKVE